MLRDNLGNSVKFQDCSSLRRVVALSKAEGKRVVIGGPYVTTSAESLPQADHIFLGEAETTLPEFVRDLERGVPKRVYQASERPALSSAPIPDYISPTSNVTARC
ncbi:MAG: hypothetical protein J2P21_01090 [Chloracidobacterium sp.]|nr:hypothetical protein [Chloracidobacterium sp.]